MAEPTTKPTENDEHKILADEALAEIRAGNAKQMVFTKDGEIAPQ